MARQRVAGYTKKDGTKVSGYSRRWEPRAAFGKVGKLISKHPGKVGGGVAVAGGATGLALASPLLLFGVAGGAVAYGGYRAALSASPALRRKRDEASRQLRSSAKRRAGNSGRAAGSTVKETAHGARLLGRELAAIGRKEMQRGRLRLTTNKKISKKSEAWQKEAWDLDSEGDEIRDRFERLISERREMRAARARLLSQEDSPRVQTELRELDERRKRWLEEMAALDDQRRDYEQRRSLNFEMGQALEREHERRDLAGKPVAATANKPLPVRLLEADKQLLARYRVMKARDEARWQKLRSSIGLSDSPQETRGAEGQASEDGKSNSKLDSLAAELYGLFWGEWKQA